MVTRLCCIAVLLLHGFVVQSQRALPPILEGESDRQHGESALAADLKKGLQKQWLRGLDERGETITIMAVGEAGVGKTTLFSNLFLRDLSSPSGPTLSILEQTVHFGTNMLQHTLRLPSTPDSRLRRVARQLLTTSINKERGWGTPTGSMRGAHAMLTSSPPSPPHGRPRRHSLQRQARRHARLRRRARPAPDIRAGDQLP